MKEVSAFELPSRRAPRAKRSSLPVRSEIRRPTSDNWCPTAPDGTVRLTLVELSTQQWRVCVWGDDDLGMERDFEPHEGASAKELYDRLARCSDITMALCRAVGMIYA